MGLVTIWKAVWTADHYTDSLRRQLGRTVWPRTCNLETLVQVPPRDPLDEFVYGSPKFKPWAVLVK